MYIVTLCHTPVDCEKLAVARWNPHGELWPPVAVAGVAGLQPQLSDIQRLGRMGKPPKPQRFRGMLQQEITRNTLPIPAQELLSWRLVLLIKLLMFDVHIAAPRTVWFSSCARMVGLHVLACMGLLALLIMFGKLDMFWNCCSGSSSETSVVETLIGDSPQSIVTHKIGKSVQYSYIYKD